MKIGQKIEIPGIPALQLDPMSADLGTSALRRDVKVYKVPESVSADKYYISVTDAGEAEDVPPSRSKDNTLLLQYDLGADNAVSTKYMHKELKNAED